MKHVTLLFLRENGKLLLAMKKRGFGVGKWNGVGGKVETDETYEQAAIRECQEEVGVTPQLLHKVGELHFFDLPDVEHYCHVYTANDWDGEPRETEEMRPQWFAKADIPFDSMWPDDKFWIPLMLDNKLFKGIVTIEDNTIQQCDIQEVNSF